MRRRLNLIEISRHAGLEAYPQNFKDATGAVNLKSKFYFLVPLLSSKSTNFDKFRF
ncbi:hypothetical protein CAMGR0001_2672 [Campylobacter gracilis RM3268]|uniref:Uncharacterized protein n=1 Tax=Campylobacter gracilis RM3268 TaxID=553220 RepID=C8PF32_9BACT|nr:hypothetical protein CAMGR0001_2672 [Campylobacter gracilis RM3268]